MTTNYPSQIPEKTMSQISQSQLLGPDDGPAFSVHRPDGGSPIILLCEHASNSLPKSLKQLGASSETMSSHAAWDPGALQTALKMSEKLDATLVQQRFSRLVYDCNRPPTSATAMPAKSEVHSIPGNANLSAAERFARTSEIYWPFHHAVSDVIARRASEGREVVIVTIHSFTKVYNGAVRDVELGILHDADARLADRMLDATKDSKQFNTQRNAPYGPQDGVTHTLQIHGIATGLENVMIEIRNDLITDDAGQLAMAEYLSKVLEASL